MELVVRVITLDGHSFSVDKAIEFQRGSKFRDLLDDLLHFAIRKRIVIQAVNSTVVIIQDLCPISDEVLLGWVLDNFFFPAFIRQDFNQGFLKVRFFLECHSISSFLRY